MRADYPDKPAKVLTARSAQAKVGGRSRVAQRQSIRLLIGRSLVRIQSREQTQGPDPEKVLGLVLSMRGRAAVAERRL